MKWLLALSLLFCSCTTWRTAKVDAPVKAIAKRAVEKTITTPTLSFGADLARMALSSLIALLLSTAITLLFRRRIEVALRAIVIGGVNDALEGRYNGETPETAQNAEGRNDQKKL